MLGVKPVKRRKRDLKIWNDEIKEALETNMKHIDIIYNTKLES